MRLKQVVLSGFRAFAATTTIDLDADCVIVSGANGQGKTSLLDGIFWTLTGRLERLGSDDKLVSLYSETGGASVSLTLATSQGDLVVTRRHAAQRTTLMATLQGEAIEGEVLRSRFGRIVVLPSDLSSEDSTSLAKTLARSLYLQQDSIRDFINADSDDTRFRVVAELCGLGRVTDLQAALQQERKAWTQATNQFDAQLVGKRSKLSDLRERAAKLGDALVPSDSLPSMWADWWHKVTQVLPSFAEPIPDVGAAASDSALDRAVRQLDSVRHEVLRRRDSVADTLKLVDTIAVSPAKYASSDVLRAAVTSAESAEAEARQALRTAEDRNVAIEQDLLRNVTSGRELRTLAELALRHLGEKCPICDQTFDRGSTTRRLQAFIDSTPQTDLPLRDLSGMVSALALLQQNTVIARDALRQSEAEAARVAHARAEVARRAIELGVEDPDVPDLRAELVRLHDDAVARLALIDSTRAQADQLSLSKVRAGELAQREEVTRQLVSAEREVAELERVLAGRERAGKVAANISEEMREASLQIVENELQRIEPLFQRIWAGIDPHPSLRAVQLVSRLSYGKGRLSMRVKDEVSDVSSESPEAILSSSQQNALAVALFLTLNVGTQSLPLATTVLDDPFQSLDDINLLGLVDLLRRIPGTRQLVVTTHEHRFAQLLARKLRPVNEARTTKVVEFDSWDRNAPLVTQRDVVKEPNPFRFVA